MSAGGWAERWRASLLDDPRPAAELRRAQGIALARSGRVSAVRVSAGRLSGRVQGKSAMPYEVEVTVGVLDDRAWEAVVEAVTGQVRHAARLLAGQAPTGLDDELEQRGVRLLPRRAEVTTASTDPDSHPFSAPVAALLETAAERLAADPFVLFRLRGRGRERFLAELAARRRGAPQDTDAVAVPAVPATGWTATRVPLAALDAEHPALDGERPLTRLGDPPGWAGGVSAEALFGPLVERGADWATTRLRAD